MAIMVSLLFIFGLGNKKIWADDDWGVVEKNQWSYEDDSTIRKLTKYNGSTANVVIPNAADFNTSGITKVIIERKTIWDVAKHVNSKNGTLKISDTGGDKVFADGEDWSAAFYPQKETLTENEALTNIKKIDLKNFDTTNVNNMEYMFCGCNSLTDLILGDSFNTSNVTNMQHMFDGCSNLINLTLGNSFDTSQTVRMNSMFDGCSKLQSLDLSKFNTSKTEQMEYMFNNCSSLEIITFGENFNTSKVLNMEYMFCGCESLKSLDLSKFDTANVGNAVKFK